MSLFANQRIIEVDFSTIKIGDPGHKAMLAVSSLQVKMPKTHIFPKMLFLFSMALN